MSSWGNHPLNRAWIHAVGRPAIEHGFTQYLARQSDTAIDAMIQARMERALNRVPFDPASNRAANASTNTESITVNSITSAITRSRREIFHCQNARLRDSGALLGSPILLLLR